MDIEELREHILFKLKNDPLVDVTLELGVTLPCGCCSETTYFYADEEELEGKSDDELIDLFESNSQIFLEHVTDWYSPYDNYISLNLS